MSRNCSLSRWVWYFYYEQYPGVSYGLSTAPQLSGPWHDMYVEDYRVPAAARHGSMLPLTRPVEALLAAFPEPSEP